MGRIRVAIEIDATTDEVWHVVEPVERHVDWMADAVAIRFDGDQHRGVGTTFVCDTKVGPITLPTTWRSPSGSPARRMGVRHTGVVTGTGAFELTPIDLGRRTRFTWTEELRFPWYLAGRLGGIVGGGRDGRHLARNLRELRRLVEG